MRKQFAADLGNAVSPSAALDLHMELLVGLRRQADADAAIVAARKLLATAPADSEDAAKAMGLAEPLTRGSAVASEAFLPFADGLLSAIAAGATAVIQPGGSMRDAEVIAAADEAGVAMVFTGMRHFRH